ncbi:uncharacterized protein IUM83_09628 [Phytophthora cinnamomi]|uniref:uncharacterized protein n=1 Tax=Phytophthora cinnamomi TaxID=4785 RepID=UPI00355971A3|nr:hypothetical protein IUM83_09628 [Phytophthora cinnamomi]
MASPPRADSAGVVAGVRRPVDDHPDSTPASASPPPTAAASRGAGAAPVLHPAPTVSVAPAPGEELPALAAADLAPSGVSLAELDAAPPSPRTTPASSADLEEGECAESKTRDLRRDDTAPASQISPSLAPARMASVISSSTIHAPLIGVAAGRRFPDTKPFESAAELAEFFQDLSPTSPSTPRVPTAPDTSSGSAAASPSSTSQSARPRSILRVRSGQEGFPLVESLSKPSSDDPAMRPVSPVAEADLAGDTPMASSPRADSAGVVAGVRRPVDDHPDSTPASASPPPTAAASRGAGAAPVLHPAPTVSVAPAPGEELPALAAADLAPSGVSLAELDAAPPSPRTTPASSADLEEGECAESKTRDLRRDDTAPASQISPSLAPAKMASVISSSTIHAPLIGVAAGRRFPDTKPFESAAELAEFFQDLSPTSPSTPRVPTAPDTSSGSAAASPSSTSQSARPRSILRVRSGQEGFPLVESLSKPSSDDPAMRPVSPVAEADLAGASCRIRCLAEFKSRPWGPMHRLTLPARLRK